GRDATVTIGDPRAWGDEHGAVGVAQLGGEAAQLARHAADAVDRHAQLVGVGVESVGLGVQAPRALQERGRELGQDRVLAIVVGGRVVGGRAVVIAGGVVVADARVVARGRVVVARGGRVGGLGRRDGLGLVLDGRRRHEGGALTAATLALAGERG